MTAAIISVSICALYVYLILPVDTNNDTGLATNGSSSNNGTDVAAEAGAPIMPITTNAATTITDPTTQATESGPDPTPAPAAATTAGQTEPQIEATPVPEPAKPTSVAPDASAGNATATSGTGDSSCSDTEQADLIKCFIYLLDDWAWNMWKIRQSLGSLNCTIHKQMDDCITTSSCSIVEAVSVSTALTEMLIYTRNSDSFLYSFLALEFACQSDGQDIISKSGQCLQTYHEGLHMLSEVEDLQDRIIRRSENDSNEQLCTFLKDRAEFMRKNALDACQSESVGRLVCKMVTDPFVRINATVFSSCKDSLCPEPETASTAVVVPAGAGKIGSQNGDPTKAAPARRPCALLSLLFPSCASLSITATLLLLPTF